MLFSFLSKRFPLDRCFLSLSDLKLNTRPDVVPVAWPKLLRRPFHQSSAGGSAYKPHVCEREICDMQVSEGQLSLNPEFLCLKLNMCVFYLME